MTPPASAGSASDRSAPARRPLRVGCGEWGFRELPLRDHFAIAADFGFRELEFGIGGGQTGRLPEEPSPADIAGFRRLAAESGLATPGCCIENDFTLPDPEAHGYRALKAFQQNAYFVLVDDVQVEDLEAPIRMMNKTTVTFVKTTPLVGG